MRERGGPGTRFRLFPEYASGYAEPEVVVLSPPAGTIGAGPSDPAMYTANAVFKPHEYTPPGYMPPFRGEEFLPARPDPAGHFDHIPVDTPQFRAAHLYGCIRRTLDVWEHYLGRRVRWWHADFLPQLELVPVVQWANAHSGPGFIETGFMRNDTGRAQLFCLNFDVISHETGHAILFSEVGVPEIGGATREYLAFHESFSDMIGLVAALHFPSVVEKLLLETGGNLYVLNLVNRLGEISDHEQVRIASNETTMADVDDIVLEPDGNWFDPTGMNRKQHAFGEPLTGALFDILIEIYQDVLVEERLIDPTLDARGWTRAEVASSMSAIAHESGRQYDRFHKGFTAAIRTARDMLGFAMAHAMKKVRAADLSFEYVAACMLEAFAQWVRPDQLPDLLDHFLWRGIDPRPFLGSVVIPGGRGRGRVRRNRRELRAEVPHPSRQCACQDPNAFIRAASLIRHPGREKVHQSAIARM